MRGKLVTELAGTFMFLIVISVSSNAGALAPLAIGLALAALVYMGGHVSGAHYNPAVTFSLLLRGVIPPATLGLYWVTQLVAAALAFSFGYLITGHTPGIHPGAGVSTLSALSAEIVFTAALALIVLNVAATRETAGNSYYGLAIGMIVAVGAFTVGPISGAAFNPAVAFGATLGAALFAHGGWSDLWIYVAGPLLGATIGAVIHWLQAPQANPVKPEATER